MTALHDAITDAQPAQPKTRPSRETWPLAVGVLAVLVTVAVIGLQQAGPTSINGYGLFPAIPVSYWVAVVSLVIGYFVLVHRRWPHPSVYLTYVGSIAVLLDLPPTLIEEQPRFPAAWVHIGFTNQIMEHGAVLHSYDARMSWPGFFAAAATVVAGTSGSEHLLPMVSWSPALLDLLFLAPLYAISRMLTVDDRVRWSGLLFFYLGDWIGQTYFSPQGYAYLLLLTALVVVLILGRSSVVGAATTSIGTPRPRSRFTVSAQDVTERLVMPRRALVALFALLLLITLALMPSHQLTPLALLLESFALVVVRRSRLVIFPVLVGLLITSYVSYFAKDYWAGHRDKLLGGHDAIASNLTSRVGGSTAHLHVVELRLAVTALLFLAAAVGAVRLARRGRLSLSLVALTAACFGLPVLQTYGGEALLRTTYFALPFAAILAAHAFYPDEETRFRGSIMAAALAITLLVAYPLTRYGNESYEQVTTNDRAVVRYLYASAPAGASFVAPVGNVPWKYRDLDRFEYRRVPVTTDIEDPKVVLSFVTDLRGPVYLLLTDGDESWGSTNDGLRPGWIDAIAKAADADSRLELVMRAGSARVYRVQEPAT